MVTTSTPVLDFTEKILQDSAKNQISHSTAFGMDLPSKNTIEAILNYSKNLEIKKSELVQEIEFIKS